MSLHELLHKYLRHEGVVNGKSVNDLCELLKGIVDNLEKQKACLPTSLILASLCQEDINNFRAAKIPYSGQADTGTGSLTPFIATYPEHLCKAAFVMGWSSIVVSFRDGQIFAKEGV